MYTYNPHWGSSLVASRGQAERLPGAPFFFPLFLVCPFLTINLFINSFIHQFLFPSIALSFSSSHGPKGWDGRETAFMKKRDCFPLSLSFSFFLESLFPRFIPSGPLSSLVECPTLWCVWGIGWRGRRGLWVEGVEIHDRVHVWMKKVDEGQEKVTKWHVDMDKVNLIRSI